MKQPIIISVGGGKGGIGKSTVVANIGAILARRGHAVGFIDADFGGANLHTFVGVPRPQKGLHDFLAGRVTHLHDVTIPTSIPGSWLISGASDILELSNPKFAQKQRIIHHLSSLPADYILIDLGAGTDFHVADFFASFQYGVIVSDSLPTSIENAYGFLKNGIIRGLLRQSAEHAELSSIINAFSDPHRSPQTIATVSEVFTALAQRFPADAKRMKLWLHSKRTFLILNMVKENNDIGVGERFVAMVKKYLDIKVTYIGYVAYSSQIRESIREMKPVVMTERSAAVTACFEAIAANLLALTKG